MEGKRCRLARVQCTTGLRLKTPSPSLGAVRILLQLITVQVKDRYRGNRWAGRVWGFQAMCLLWTLRVIHFSNFRTMKILTKGFGKLEISDIGYYLLSSN
jgi:ABC-type polysaccharide/polyol phosphate export permease